MKYFLILIFLLIPYTLVAQTYCICGKSQLLPINTKPDTIYRMSDDFGIAVCGFTDRVYGITCYTEFSITVCGQQHVLRNFNAVDYYLLETLSDTFMMSEMKVMPTGEDLEFRLEPWSFIKIYTVRDTAFFEELLVWVEERNTNLKLASVKEKEFIRKKLKETKIGKTLVSDDILGLVFYGAISGDEFLEKEFNMLSDYFLIDGAYLLWYEELKVMLEEWKNYIRSIK